MRKIKRDDDRKDRLDKTARALGEAKEARDSAEKDFKDGKTVALALFEDEGVRSHRTVFDDKRTVTAQVKDGRSKVNPERLKKAIGAKAFNKLTKPVVDEEKVKAAIKLGDLDPNVVASCMDQGDDYMDVRFHSRRKKS